MSLSEYRKKRDFSKTDEPKSIKTGVKRKEIFVVQKHRARSLHYDFRIKVGKVLKSWAVPKGLSRSTQIKRLAVQTEDHPLSYANFHGTIPKGEYGAGKVEIWDRGTFKNLKDKSLLSCLKDGHLELWLQGKKAQGGYALVKMKEKNWILVKMNDKKIEERINALKGKKKKQG